MKKKRFSDEQLQRASGIDIVAMLQGQGEKLKKQGRVYRWMRYDSTVIDRNRWYRHSREIAAIHPNMIVKIPMTVEGLKAVKVLHSEGIKTNVTLIFTANQALLAARAGATYVSPFLGRLDDISTPGMDLIRTIADIFAMYDDIDTQIIAASVRNPIHVIDCALAGADIATVPYNVLMQMVKHPLTDQGIEKFKKDYIAVFGE